MLDKIIRLFDSEPELGAFDISSIGEYLGEARKMASAVAEKAGWYAGAIIAILEQLSTKLDVLNENIALLNRQLSIRPITRQATDVKRSHHKRKDTNV